MFSKFLDVVLFTGVVSVGSIYIYKNYGNDIRKYCVDKYGNYVLSLKVKEKEGTLSNSEKQILSCIDSILEKGAEGMSPEEAQYHKDNIDKAVNNLCK